MRVLFLFMVLPFVAYSQNGGQEFRLKGSLLLSKPVDKVFISYLGTQSYVRDSFTLNKGQFEYKGNIAEPTVANLQVRYVMQPGDQKPVMEGTQVFIEPAVIEIQAKDSLYPNKVKGSPGQDDFRKIQAISIYYNQKEKLLNELYSNARAANDMEALKNIEKQYADLSGELREKYIHFIKTNPSSPVAFHVFKQTVGYTIDPDVADPLFKLLPENVQKWPSAMAMKDQIEIAKKTAIGKYAMEFTQNDTLGIPVSLSSFKGKFLLIDFWASWCGPCRRENPNLVKNFQKYKDRNFTILGVSLDRSDAKDRWLAAIHKDGLTWTQVSDLKYWDNEVAKQYGIRSIPQNLLLDPEGRIIAKNLRGEALEKKLEEIFGQ